MQGICIQGPLDYYKEICENWKGWPNVIVSTWTSEPQDKVDYIRSQGITIIQSIPPNESGDMNVNYQCASTFRGLNYLHQKGCTEVLKVRSDHIISDVKSLLEILWGRKMAFLAISNGVNRPGIYYELGGNKFYSHSYPSDNIIYGYIEDMMLMFNFQADKKYGIPPESLITYNYLIESKLKFIMEFGYFIENNISFFLRECINKNITIHWLKRDLEMISFYNNDYFLF